LFYLIIIGPLTQAAMKHLPCAGFCSDSGLVTAWFFLLLWLMKGPDRPPVSLS